MSSDAFCRATGTLFQEANYFLEAARDLLKEEKSDESPGLVVERAIAVFDEKVAKLAEQLKLENGDLQSLRGAVKVFSLATNTSPQLEDEDQLQPLSLSPFPSSHVCAAKFVARAGVRLGQSSSSLILDHALLDFMHFVQKRKVSHLLLSGSGAAPEGCFDVSFDPAQPPPCVAITGAEGPSAGYINGKYQIVLGKSTICHEGVGGSVSFHFPIYKKECDTGQPPRWVEFNSQLSQWECTSDEGRRRREEGLTFLEHDCRAYVPAFFLTDGMRNRQFVSLSRSWRVCQNRGNFRNRVFCDQSKVVVSLCSSDFTLDQTGF